MDEVVAEMRGTWEKQAKAAGKEEVSNAEGDNPPGIEAAIRGRPRGHPLMDSWACIWNLAIFCEKHQQSREIGATLEP